MTYQTIIVDGWKDVDLSEVLNALTPFSKIILQEPSLDVIELSEFSELVSRRVN